MNGATGGGSECRRRFLFIPLPPPCPAIRTVVHPATAAPYATGKNTVPHAAWHTTLWRQHLMPRGDGRHADASRGLCHGVCEVMAGVSPGSGVSVVAPRHIVGIQLQRAADCIVGDDTEHGLGLVHVGLHDGGGIFYPPALDGGGHE